MDITNNNQVRRGYGHDDNYVGSGDLVERMLAQATHERDRQRSEKREKQIYIDEYKDALKKKGVM